MTGKIDDGGPAYPREDYQGGGSGQTGMSLRDWFAGHALAGMMSHTGSYGMGNGPQNISDRCYELADAMIKARGQA
jgi:hypothetical protein